jgi:hypothetical protein
VALHLMHGLLPGARLAARTAWAILTSTEITPALMAAVVQDEPPALATRIIPEVGGQWI